MQFDPKLVEAMALAARNAPTGGWATVEDAATAPMRYALTALCAHLRITPEALHALAKGEAVVVPKLLTDELRAVVWRRPDGALVAVCAMPDWLHSLDAAASLVPEGWRVSQMVQGSDGTWDCYLVSPLVALDAEQRRAWSTGALTEPRARTAAALRAALEEAARDE